LSRFGQRTTILAFALMVTAAAARADTPFPEPPALSPAVSFWVRVYTEASTDGGFIHDARLLDVVYEHLRFEGETSSRVRQNVVERGKAQWRDVLERLAEGGAPSGPREEQVVRLLTIALGHAPEPRDYKDAKWNLRFQLGQRDKFREGLVRSGAYETEMRQVFREQGMPDDLALLPHVESSFNVRAYSKDGAAGIWQFMRGTGRRFMKVDYVVDERLDPITATRAAARLLHENYATLGSWPLALTAYNHGAAGVARAVRNLGTDQIDEIVRRYDSATFGFASRNFYAQFLAARKVMKSYESYFGPVRRDSPAPVEVVHLPFYADVTDVSRRLGVSTQDIAELNPALRQPVFRSNKRIPRGYALRVPAHAVGGDAAQWVASVPTEMRHSEQHESRYYTVRRGDTLSKVAAANHTTIPALLAQNELRARTHIYPGQVLQLPERGGRHAAPEEPVQVASSEPVAPAGPPAPSAAAPEPPPVPVEPPAPPAEPPAPALAAASASAPSAPAPLPAEPTETAATLVAAAESAGSSADPADTAPAVEPSDASANPDAAEDAAGATAELGTETLPENAARATAPVVVALAEPAVAKKEEAPPAGEPDESPFRRADGNRVIVDDDETLGHFADWLEVTPQHLRNLNKLRPRRPIQVGQALKLDFSKVSPEQFQQRRLEYHKGIEEDFFGSFRVTGTVEHSLRSGDTLWLLSHKLYGVPTWLIHRYNPDVDFSKLHPGVKLEIPIVEKVAS
jgi:membrane-bound lytic murein transglycosylase D